MPCDTDQGRGNARSIWVFMDRRKPQRGLALQLSTRWENYRVVRTPLQSVENE